MSSEDQTSIRVRSSSSPTKYETYIYFAFEWPFEIEFPEKVRKPNVFDNFELGNGVEKTGEVEE